jgi:hypothetical protein
MPKRRKPDPLLLRVCAELGAGRITEAYISDPKWHVDGLCEFGPRGRVTISPHYQTVDSLVHELIHRLQPEWSESYVRGRTTRLVRALTEQQLQTIYDEYQKRKRTRKSPVVVEEN